MEHDILSIPSAELIVKLVQCQVVTLPRSHDFSRIVTCYDGDSWPLVVTSFTLVHVFSNAVTLTVARLC